MEKTSVLSVRVTGPELEVIEKIALLDGLTRADAMRLALRSFASWRGFRFGPPTPPDPKLEARP